MHWHLGAAVLVTGALALAVYDGDHDHGRNIGVGPGRACNLPKKSCLEAPLSIYEECSDLVEMPLFGIGYVDFRNPEEFGPPASTSFIRRDLAMAVQYAAAKVACKAATWNTGHGAAIGLGDMSEWDGSTPGMFWDRPRHPRNTHVDGLAIDIAYYQKGTPDNEPRPICKHFDRDGEAWRCVAKPDRLDAWRTALFLGALLEEANIRVIGMDGVAAEELLDAFDELCRVRWIEKAACARRSKIQFETRDTGRYWFRGHHNHLHVAWNVR